MQIKQITTTERDTADAQTWNEFVIKNSSPASFLQSWEWGDFREKCLGEKIFRYAVYEEDLVCVAQFVKRALPGGRFYLNCAKGPLIKTQNTRLDSTIESKRATNKTQGKIFELLISEIKKIAKEEKIVFFRIAPAYEVNGELRIMNYEFKEPKILTNLIEPENTLVLNLEKSEDEILQEMHQKTRYNIRLAEKKRVKIKQLSVTSDQDIRIFYNLLKETAQRDKINIFNKDYYKNILEIKNLITDHCSLIVKLFMAEFEGKALSAIILIGFGDTATYFHGASSDEHREVMPNHAIQWTAIKWAKKNGYKYYDFWGISNDKKDWSGITRFKRGFVSEKTGREINYPGTYDFILNKKWYNLYRLGKLLTPFRGVR